MTQEQIGQAAMAPRDDAGHSARTAILDAAIRCFASHGWAGTNMLLIARETGMTRGKIQYYFPAIDDLKYAAIEHLYQTWRDRYFGNIDASLDLRAQIDAGIDLLWQQVQDPLHLAMLEIRAEARRDEALRTMLQRLDALDEAARDAATALAFPEMAAAGRRELQLMRRFVTVFVDGLASHSFGGDTEQWQEAMLATLKRFVDSFWADLGLPTQSESDHDAHPPKRLWGEPAQTVQISELKAVLQSALAMVDQIT